MKKMSGARIQKLKAYFKKKKSDSKQVQGAKSILFRPTTGGGGTFSHPLPCCHLFPVQFLANVQLQFLGNVQLQFLANVQLQFLGNVQLQFLANVQLQFLANVQLQFLANVQLQFLGNAKHPNRLCFAVHKVLKSLLCGNTLTAITVHGWQVQHCVSDSQDIQGIKAFV